MSALALNNGILTKPSPPSGSVRDIVTRTRRGRDKRGKMHLYVFFVVHFSRLVACINQPPSFCAPCSHTFGVHQHTARKIQHVLQMQFYDKQDKLRLQEKKRLADQHARQVAEVQAQLAALEVKRKEGDAKLQEVWKDRHKKFWDRIESAIKTEEENIKRKIEAERRAREEEERRRQEEEKRKQEEERKRKEDEERKRVEEELRRRLQEEKRQQEEEAKRQAKEEEERKKSEEEETKKRTEEEARIKKERFQTEEQSRVSLGLTTADEDWTHSRQTLLVWFRFRKPLSYVIHSLALATKSGPHENYKITEAPQVDMERHATTDHSKDRAADKQSGGYRQNRKPAFLYHQNVIPLTLPPSHNNSMTFSSPP